MALFSTTNPGGDATFKALSIQFNEMLHSICRSTDAEMETIAALAMIRAANLALAERYSPKTYPDFADEVYQNMLNDASALHFEQQQRREAAKKAQPNA